MFLFLLLFQRILYIHIMVPKPTNYLKARFLYSPLKPLSWPKVNHLAG